MGLTYSGLLDYKKDTSANFGRGGRVKGDHQGPPFAFNHPPAGDNLQNMQYFMNIVLFCKLLCVCKIMTHAKT